MAITIDIVNTVLKKYPKWDIRSNSSMAVINTSPKICLLKSPTKSSWFLSYCIKLKEIGLTLLILKVHFKLSLSTKTIVGRSSISGRSSQRLFSILRNLKIYVCKDRIIRQLWKAKLIITISKDYTTSRSKNMKRHKIIFWKVGRSGASYQKLQIHICRSCLMINLIRLIKISGTAITSCKLVFRSWVLKRSWKWKGKIKMMCLWTNRSNRCCKKAGLRNYQMLNKRSLSFKEKKSLSIIRRSFCSSRRLKSTRLILIK